MSSVAVRGDRSFPSAVGKRHHGVGAEEVWRDTAPRWPVR